MPSASSAASCGVCAASDTAHLDPLDVLAREVLAGATDRLPHVGRLNGHVEDGEVAVRIDGSDLALPQDCGRGCRAGTPGTRPFGIAATASTELRHQFASANCRYAAASCPTIAPLS